MTEDPHWPRASVWLEAGGTPGGRSLGVVGVPLSLTSISQSGAHETPAAIRLALRRFTTYSAELDVSIEALAVTDHGELDVAELMGDHAIAGVMAGLSGLPVSDLLVVLGGDNAVTRPVLRHLASDLSSVGLLTLDAHHDVREFHAGATNGTPIRGLIDDGLDPRHIAQIGIGDFTNSETYRRWCDEQGITVVTASAARAEGVAACVRRCLDVLAKVCEWVYVDLDVDVLDAAFAPGCPGARPGGFAPYELHAAAREAVRHPAVRAIDIVEVDATADPLGLTVDAAALCLLSAAAGLAARP